MPTPVINYCGRCGHTIFEAVIDDYWKCKRCGQMHRVTIEIEYKELDE